MINFLYISLGFIIAIVFIMALMPGVVCCLICKKVDLEMLKEFYTKLCLEVKDERKY